MDSFFEKGKQRFSRIEGQFCEDPMLILNSVKNIFKDMLPDMAYVDNICGAMSHMCVDTTVRAAFDIGYSCRVVSDACATRKLAIDGKTIDAVNVHAAFMAALSTPFAQVVKTKNVINHTV